MYFTREIFSNLTEINGICPIMKHFYVLKIFYLYLFFPHLVFSKICILQKEKVYSLIFYLDTCI